MNVRLRIYQVLLFKFLDTIYAKGILFALFETIRTIRTIRYSGLFAVRYSQLSFDAFFPSFPLAESPPRDLQITAYK